MILEHCGKRPTIHESAYVAPTAVVCGDVTIGEHSRVLFGAILVAEGGPVAIGSYVILMEHAVVRGTPRHPARVGGHVFVGPHSHLTGCTVDDEAFLATGVTILNGAHVGRRTQVRNNGVVHVGARLFHDAIVPIGWIAVGDPAQIIPPQEHDRIWSGQDETFPLTVFGLERAPARESVMPRITQRYARVLADHQADRIL